jgi:hypothetical protein
MVVIDTKRSVMSVKKKAWMLLLVSLFASLVAAGGGGPAQADSAYHRIPQYYNGKCLDLRAEDLHTIQIWSCSQATVQQWSEIFYANLHAFGFRNKKTGECLAVFEYTSGAQLQTGICGNSTWLVWKVIYANNTCCGWHQVLQNWESGLCIDLTNDSDYNGTLVRQYPCNVGDFGQHWKIGG